MLHIILLLHLLFGAVSSLIHRQTEVACQDFAYTNYTAWSESYIGTWCKDHDPSSTAQCAPVTWPTYVPFPTPTSLHGFLRKPQLSTRKDCIARSLAFNMTNRHHSNIPPGHASDGLVDAVSCNVYKFDRVRTEECVCFPVYVDLNSTTISYYPPTQVISSYLLAAATQSAPNKCNKKTRLCPQTVSLIGTKYRSHMTPGEFPYCTTATPAQQVFPPLVARTISPEASASSVSFDWGPRPTSKPQQHCKNTTNPLASQRCENNKCLWASFLETVTVTHSSCFMIYNRAGEEFYEDWQTSKSNSTKPHWGLPGLRTTSTIDKYCKMPTDTSVPDHHDPPCRDEQDCRAWCHAAQQAKDKRFRTFMIITAVVSGIALLGMLWTWCRGGLRRARRRRRERRIRKQIEEQSVQEMDLVQPAPGGDGSVDYLQQPGDGQATGSMRQRAEGIRGRPRVYFQSADMVYQEQ